LTSVTDAAQRTGSYTYQSGRLASIITPLGGSTTFGYIGASRLTQIVDALGNTTNIAYSGGRMASVTDPEAVAHAGPSTTFAYRVPTTGKVTVTRPLANSTNPPGAGIVYALDANGEILSVTDEDSRTTSSTYDVNRNRVSATDPGGNTTSWTYDGNGNMLTQARPVYPRPQWTGASGSAN